MNFEIENNGEVSKEFLNLGISNFKEACNYISQIQYKRNSNKNDVLCIFKDKVGTCSTKHSILRKLALENNHQEIKLILGIFKMDKDYAPKIKSTLSQNQLNYIPEAHNYLKIENQCFDFTKPDSKYSDFENKLLEEHEIEFDQINEHKIEIHKNYLRNWIINYPRFDLDTIWKIREKCISDLQN
ncbi:hypothetical protein [Myroides guanonis]|uniref:Uncharacterized protein n=1 Tax=Myroides guanonis TaxID=1150112 RepID=A0A1I3QJI9_9FLAO|nr:hypothetical protein [Myroides guanonis]SFJ34264.1 hypothetical protein SAMN04487893_10624 [Myroides guanonis]